MMATPDCVSDPDFQDDLSLIVAYWNTFREEVSIYHVWLDHMK